MFGQKLKEILELVLEAADKTDISVTYNYDNRSGALLVVVGKTVFIASDDENLEQNANEIRKALLKLLK